MWNRIKGLSLVVAGAVAVSGCEASGGPLSPFAAEGAEVSESRGRAFEPSIVEIAQSTGVHNILVAAVVALELDGVLSGKNHFTVFAPTDAAFNAVCDSYDPATCIGNLIGALGSVDAVRNVVLYHVTNGDRNATSVVNSGSLQMLNGGVANVSVMGGTAYIAGAPIVIPNVRARNGIVHVVGGVMLPPS
jgi:uncharacterized surface protein with fasciclin (FAS1) repeats